MAADLTLGLISAILKKKDRVKGGEEVTENDRSETGK